MKLLGIVLLATSLLSASPRKSYHKYSGVVHTAKEAKAIAEQETGGTAVSARRISLNAASGGWEVEVHMPKEDRGWRCVVDNDTHLLRSKERIPNPGARSKGRR